MDLKKWRDRLLFADKKGEMELEEISVFPLARVVLFPGTVLPLHIFEEPYKLMADDLLETRRPLAMAGNGAIVGSICGGGDVGLVTAYPDGRKDIFVEGKSRFEIVKCIQQKPYIRALAKRIPDVPYREAREEQADHLKLSSLVRRWIFLTPDLEDRYIDYVNCFATSHALADFIAFSFLPQAAEKQKLLEMVERKKRVARIIAYLEGEIRKLESREGRLISPLGAPSLLH